MGVPLQTYVGNVYMSLRPYIEIRAALIVFNFIDGHVGVSLCPYMEMRSVLLRL